MHDYVKQRYSASPPPRHRDELLRGRGVPRGCGRHPYPSGEAAGTFPGAPEPGGGNDR